MTENIQIKTPQGESATYSDFRRVAYPPIEEQLDVIYHQGIDAWKAVITTVKNQYPKENE
jgi:hypothetical protein